MAVIGSQDGLSVSEPA